MADPQRHICVIGLGAIGLPVAISLACSGAKVTGVDPIPERRAQIQEGAGLEPGLLDQLQHALAQESLELCDSPPHADVYLILTPSHDTLEQAISHLRPLAKLIASHCSPHHQPLVILESTSMPGATQAGLVDSFCDLDLHPGQHLFVAHAPERIAVGATLQELHSQPRVVAGATPKCQEAAIAFYQRWFNTDVVPAHSLKEAELCKLLENAHRWVNITLANEFASLGHTLDVDMRHVFALANTHTRVSLHHFGAGIGGHCLPYAAKQLSGLGTQELMPTFQQALTSQDSGQLHTLNTLRLRHTLDHVALWGLTYKADVLDTRHAPAQAWRAKLHAHGVKTITTYDPLITPEGSWQSSVKDADFLFLLIAHRAWHNYDVQAIATQMKHPKVVDLCGAITDPKPWLDAGFQVWRQGIDI